MSEERTIVRKLFDIEARFIPDGEFVNDDGKTVAVSRQVKIASGRDTIKISALGLAALFQVVRSDRDVQAFVEDLLQRERSALESLDFKG